MQPSAARFRPSCLVLAALLLLSPALLGAVPAAGQSADPAATPARSLVAGPIDNASRAVIAGTHPSWATAGNRVEVVAGNTPSGALTLVLRRPAERQAALDQLVRDQQNPSSPSYHRWLTPEQVGSEFGPSDADVAAARAWLEASGFEVGAVSPSRTSIGFRGTAQMVNQAFGVQLGTYRVGSEMRVAPAADLAVPSALAPAVLGVEGLTTRHFHGNSVLRPQAVTGGKKGALTLPDGSHYVTPADFATIYDVPANASASGQRIAIVGKSRVLAQDIANFNLVTGATVPQPNVIIPTAFGGVDPGPAGSTSATAPNDQFEQTLDVTRAGSVAPGAAIDLIVSCDTLKSDPTQCDTASNDPNYTNFGEDGVTIGLNYVVNESPVVHNVVSVSYSSCDYGAQPSDGASIDSFFEQAAVQGQSVFISSGDSGAAGCVDSNSPITVSSDPSQTALSTNYLCASGYVTCVGGTSFSDTANPGQYWSGSNDGSLGSALGYIPEGAWNDGYCTTSQGTTQCYTSASGGGFTTSVPTPAFQTGNGVPGTQGRYTPDVSFVAGGNDYYFICYAALPPSYGDGSCTVQGKSFGFSAAGGTSASAPGMAGVAALLNAKKGSAAGSLNPELYRLAASNSSNQVFHDATVATSAVSNCLASVVSACNNSLPGPTSISSGVLAGYLLTTGFDEVTGLGSLDVGKFLSAYGGAVLPTPTVALTVTPGTVDVGNAAVLAATVSGSGGVPTGTVNFYSGTNVLAGPVAVNSSGAASANYQPSAAGTIPVTAVYSGDVNYSPATSAAVNLTAVVPAATTTVLSAANTSPASNQWVAVTATIGGVGSAAPTGALTVNATNATVATSFQGTASASASIPVTGAATTLWVLPAAAGPITLNASYSGDVNYDPSTAPAFGLTAGPALSFTVSGAAVTVAAGQTGQSALTFTGQGGYQPASAGGLSVTCTGLPTGAACASTLAAASNGGYTLSITTTARSSKAILRTGSVPPAGGRGMALAMLLPGMLALGGLLATRRRIRGWQSLAGLALLLRAVGAMAGCGGGGSSNGGTGGGTTGTPAGTTTVSFTLTSAASQTSGSPQLTGGGTVTLTVQ
jgi:subtilase family serine protease